MTNWHPGWEIGGIVDLEKQIFSHFVSLCKNLKISNPVIIFAYQQSFKVLLRFVNEMLGAELYQIDFMGRESKLICWTTFLKYQNKWTSNSSFLHVWSKFQNHSLYFYFLKQKGKFWVIGVALLIACFTQKTEHCPCKICNSSQILKTYIS